MKKHPTLGIMVRSDGLVLHPAYYAANGHVFVEEYWTRGYYDKDGYLRVIINKKRYAVHRLVAETFKPNPENKPCIDHNNRLRDDNDYNNLSWVTYKENNYNTSRNLPIGERKCDLSSEDYLKNRRKAQYYKDVEKTRAYRRNAAIKFRNKKEVENV